MFILFAADAEAFNLRTSPTDTWRQPDYGTIGDPACIKMRLDRIALVDLPQVEADRVKRMCNVK